MVFSKIKIEIIGTISELPGYLNQADRKSAHCKLNDKVLKILFFSLEEIV